MPRFTILEHDSPRGLHWDMLIEFGACLRSWALEHPPNTLDEVEALRLPDHRVEYLDFEEGPISGNRGTARRWDHGTYTMESQSEEEFRLVLFGDKLQGQASIRQSAEDDNRWLFTWNPK